MRRLTPLLIAVTLFLPQFAAARIVSPAETRRADIVKQSRRTLRQTMRDWNAERLTRATERQTPLVPLAGMFDSIEAGVSIRYPAQWERQNIWEEENALTLAVMFLSPKQATGSLIRQNINLVLEDVPAQMTLQEYTAEGLRHESELLPEFQLISSERSVVAGHPGQRVRFTARTDSGTMGFEQVWVLRNSKAYIWTFADDALTFNANMATFEAMLATLIIR